MKTLKDVLNESLMDVSHIIAPVISIIIGSAIGFGLGEPWYLKAINDNDRSIKDAINLVKQDKQISKICKRLQEDPEVKEFIEDPKRAGWRKMLASKLNPDEIQYLNHFNRTRVKDPKKFERGFFSAYID